MGDLINRQNLLELIDWYEHQYSEIESYLDSIREDIKSLPSAESEIIRCKDCKWWDRKFDDSPMGYCMAAKHNYYSSHWEIHIQRTYGKNFFCADAEPKEEVRKNDEY